MGATFSVYRAEKRFPKAQLSAVPHPIRGMIGANPNRTRTRTRVLAVGATFVLLVGAFCSLSPALHRLGVGTPPEKWLDPLFGLGSIILGVQPEAEAASPAPVSGSSSRARATPTARASGQAPADDDDCVHNEYGRDFCPPPPPAPSDKVYPEALDIALAGPADSCSVDGTAFICEKGACISPVFTLRRAVHLRAVHLACESGTEAL